MSDINLTASSRAALTTLQSTASLMGRTQGRLTSGLKVASAIDDAVSFFQAKGLTDRASDFGSRKDQIDQGISSLTAAVNGTTIADGILKQMKGVIGSVRTADTATRATLTSQFNDLAKQLNSAEGDANYQGLNLVNNSTATLTVYFNQGTGAQVTVTGQNLNASGILSLASAASAGVLSVMMSGGGLATDNSGFSVLSDSTSRLIPLTQVRLYLVFWLNSIRDGHLCQSWVLALFGSCEGSPVL